MRTVSLKLAGTVALTLLLALLSCSAVEEQATILLTAESAGPIKLGMSIDEARKEAKDWEFVRGMDETALNPLIVEVRREGKHILTLKALEGEYDPDAESHPINGEAEIFMIMVLDKSFRTKEGIGIGSTVSEAEKVFGKLEGMYNVPRVGETGRFSNLPEWLPYSTEAPGYNFIFDSELEDSAGVYEQIPDCEFDNPVQCNVAKRYAKDAFIAKIVLLPKLEE
ncbi:MAG: hypothetical protein IPM63_13520 [Acidobacteriota bacterium]|nr:MAG: hypothetical protein IPM63_13520 [Acidobacteriota bacterium]